MATAAHTSSQTASTATATGPRQWSEPGVGTHWKHAFFRLVIRLLGRRAAYAIAWFVVLWYVALYPGIRRRTRCYLDRRFPENSGRWRRFWDSHRLVRSFAVSLIDQAALAILGPRALNATFPDFDRLRALLDEGSGVVLVNAHVGCWQVAMSILGKLETPIAVVMIPEGGAAPPARAGAAQAPLRIIDPRRGLDAALDMIKTLQRGEVLGLMGDRAFGGESGTVRVSLLGAPAEISASPYRMASAADAPVAVVLAAKTDASSYRIRLARVIRPPGGLGRDPAATAPWAREFAEALEEFVAEHPWQYFNFYDLWAPGVPVGGEVGGA